MNIADYCTDAESLREALLRAEFDGLRICKHADPIEDAREGLTVDEADDVCSEDPSLIYVGARPNTCHRRDDRIDLLEYTGPVVVIDHQLGDGTSEPRRMVGVYDLSGFVGRRLKVAQAAPDLYGQLSRWVPAQ